MAITLMILSTLFLSCSKESSMMNPVSPVDSAVLYRMPEESALHEGTWLQWPHEYLYGRTFRDRLDETWVAMTKALVNSEKVHIIVYDNTELERVSALLKKAQISLAYVEFTIARTDDVWIRDNGPIYVKDNNGKLLVEDWGFNGWGEKAAYENCDRIPAQLAANQNVQTINLNEVIVNEGGSVEIDGNGTLMAFKSSVLNKNRNPGMTQQQAESIFTKYLGTTHFIWLEGEAGLDITDMHIDGFARFADKSTIITMADDDLLYWQVPEHDITTLYEAVNRDGQPYNFVNVPLTKNDVTTTYGKNIGKASYINYYIGNTVVLVPNYNDPNDTVANAIIQKHYPGRKVIGIDCRNLFANGGMVHCVTQQQPK
ncbi:agmatine deiminase family protein [Sphingobacterium spiritivorum]|uniref:agmatine deiminase family protein n=1 Tax=Sphingobacterium spiritivorum TaxID=258 RepID=UPI003DA6AAC4